ncbi:MAG: hypothetical protein ACFFBX_05745 [Promethearchaeota archaeon]
MMALIGFLITVYAVWGVFLARYNENNSYPHNFDTIFLFVDFRWVYIIGLLILFIFYIPFLVTMFHTAQGYALVGIIVLVLKALSAIAFVILYPLTMSNLVYYGWFGNAVTPDGLWFFQSAWPFGLVWLLWAVSDISFIFHWLLTILS